MFAKKLVVQILQLNLIFLSFVRGVPVNCENKTVTDRDLFTSSIGESLPDIPLERFKDKHYYFGAIFEGNYFQALQYCNYHGMALISIETKEENDFLFEKFKDFLGAGQYFFWTSGTTLPGNQWVWLETGRPVIFANWLPNQPDNAGSNEKCLEVRYLRTSKALVWNDHVCTIPKHVICETRVVKSLKLATNSVPSV